MDALPYVDTLLKEFLLFRGFTSSLQAFNADLAADKGCGFQASQISELVFHNLIPQHEYRELVSLLDFLNARIYCHLDSSFEPTIRKLEVSLLWLFVVHASRAGKTDKIKEFFSEYGESLLQGPDAPDWHVWFALPYLKAPARDPRFQCYFSRDWAALVETSLRNFLAEGQRMREQQQQQSSALVSRQEWLEGHEAALTCCCFSPSGCNVASASSDGVVRIWAPEGLQGDTSRAAVLLCGGAVTALAWDRRADKVVLVGTRGKGIKAWHVDTKRMVSHIQLEPPFPDVLDVTCSPVEPIFAVSACEAPPTAPSLAAAARYGKLSLWNMRAFKRIQTFAVAGEPAMCSTSFSPDGRLIAASCADATLRIFDVSSRAQVMSLPVGSANVFARFLGDAQNLLTLASDGVLRHWALAPHQLEWLRAHTAAVTTVDWHPTANAVVSGSVNHTLCITRLSL
ncbi:hypothetical protein WJX72_011380 [[Myrmecia] bisecta]|uniref:ARMC9 CTLH-like domain-containing protein n=1 Tax=[Myrmecia] bisecta TaxID=41462 RepID=A0AAW1PXB4_9CHLO